RALLSARSAGGRGDGRPGRQRSRGAERHRAPCPRSRVPRRPDAGTHRLRGRAAAPRGRRGPRRGLRDRLRSARDRGIRGEGGGFPVEAGGGGGPGTGGTKGPTTVELGPAGRRAEIERSAGTDRQNDGGGTRQPP